MMDDSNDAGARRWYDCCCIFDDSTEDERTHLIDRGLDSIHCHRFWIFLLMAIFLTAVSLSTYLLVIQGETPEPSFSYVPRTGWSSQPSCVNVSQLQLPVREMFLLPTNTSHCRNESDCLKAVRELETADLYNFVVTSDGRVYEGAGWSCPSAFGAFTVSVLGTLLTDVQVDKLGAFLEFSVERGWLESCYEILMEQPTTRYLSDAVLKLEETRNTRC
ncbi:hypothetical protein NQ315_001202 [Exocentrus adspersus]|uniref:Peptidoglycan recognition protein family domain-containing protein n=1 Tax=Exocentrus adspersus TaxID=1586481 RepID=A0AAV8WH15_9CUCU|nr:hypothetical protein NQ315_001202 [Exocentrus adspersus]